MQKCSEVIPWPDQTGERIRIRMEGYDHEVLDRTAAEIVKTALRQPSGSSRADPAADAHRAVHGAALAPHIDRKSREQFEIRTHKRLIDILKPTRRPSKRSTRG